MRELRSIVLAAGKGTRMKSERPKVLHEVCGRPMLHHVLNVVQEVGSLKTYVVVGHQFAEVEAAVAAFKKVSCVQQKKLLGTADAVKAAQSEFEGYNGHVLIVCGDTPLLNKNDLKELIRRHLRNQAVATVLTAVVHDPTGYGRIIRDQQGLPVAIREDKDAEGLERQIAEINVGVYCFKSRELFRALSLIRKNPLKQEYYLTDIIEILSEEGKLIEAFETRNPDEGLGINSRRDLAQAEAQMRARIIEQWMERGVTFVDPSTTYVAADVRIGEDTVIRPCTVIEPDVRIGRRCRVGPFARLRPGTRLKDDVEIGNFSEVSRSTIGEHSLMKHFGFLGDATLGKNVNVGAGVVTANYDGKNKNKTRISDEAFIGSDAILIAPVQIGKKAVVGAASVVTKGKKVPDGGKAIGMPATITSRSSDT